MISEVLGLCVQQDLIIALYMLDRAILPKGLRKGLIHKVQLQRISFLNDLRKSVHGHMVVVVEFHFYGHCSTHLPCGKFSGNLRTVSRQAPPDTFHGIRRFSDLTLFSRIEQKLLSRIPNRRFLCASCSKEFVSWSRKEYARWHFDAPLRRVLFVDQLAFKRRTNDVYAF